MHVLVLNKNNTTLLTRQSLTMASCILWLFFLSIYSPLIFQQYKTFSIFQCYLCLDLRIIFGYVCVRFEKQRHFFSIHGVVTIWFCLVKLYGFQIILLVSLKKIRWYSCKFMVFDLFIQTVGILCVRLVDIQLEKMGLALLHNPQALVPFVGRNAID